jgi:hypothetical protein
MLDSIVKLAGKAWRSWSSVAVWPWPAVVILNAMHKVSWLDYRDFGKVIQAGDILLSRTDSFFLSNWAIRGTFFKHAAVYTGGLWGVQDPETHYITPLEQPHIRGTQLHKRTVVEAIGDGVVCRDFGEAFFHSDWIVAVRPWTCPAEQDAIVETAVSEIGKPYNCDFDWKTHKKFYCTELAAYCLEKAGIVPPDMGEIPKSVAGLLLPFMPRKKAWLADSFLDYRLMAASGTSIHHCNISGRRHKVRA